MNVIEKNLRRIIPKPAQVKEVESTAEDLLDTVTKATRRIPYETSTRLVGSVAKGTYLFRPDIDVFILFPMDVARSELEELGLGVGESVLNGEERFAEHPYIHGVFKGFEVDIVPCYAISDPKNLKSAVDRTPFHTDFVRSNLKAGQRDQVRLLKLFMKGIGVYGAEAKVQGFSGYLAELLILYYDDFEGVAEAAEEWREGITLSLSTSGSRKFHTPLVFFDPVDSNRNVASALSENCFATYVQACKEFVSRPDDRFFFPRPRRNMTRQRVAREMERRETRLVGIRLARPALTDDNLYPQVRKTLDGMISTLESNDFIVLDKSYSIGNNYVMMLAEIQSDTLPRTKKHVGPPVTSEHAPKFLEKWVDTAVVGPYIEDGRWVTIIARGDTRAKDLLQAKLAKAALGNDLRSLEGMEVFSHGQLLRSGPLSALTDLLDKRAPWRR
jgi:tRNA nucleotidyltransferase (CCA-adding enzyme)